MPTAASEQGRSVSTFVVERDWPGVSAAPLGAAVSRADRSAAEMRHEGRHIRYLHSTLVPDDETAFCFFEAAECQDVIELNRRADVPFDRIAEAVTLVPQTHKEV